MATNSNVIVVSDFIRTNTKGGVKHAANYLDYIALREGTDVSVSLKEIQKETENQLLINKDFEQSKNTQHLFNHIDYMGNREGVVKDSDKEHGLFDAHGIPDISTVRNEIRNLSNTPLYRFIISLREETAVNLDFTDKDAWARMARTSMPFVAEQMRIPLENFNWVCAYHIKQGHPHIHIAAWDKTDKSRPNSWEQIPEKNLAKIRSIFINNVNRERSIEMDIIKDELRKSITGDLRSDAKDIVDYLEYGKRPDMKDWNNKTVMSINDRKMLGQHIKTIAAVLPTKGSTAYKYQKPEVKALVDKAIDDVLKIEKFKTQYDQYLNIQKEAISMYRSNEDVIQEKLNEIDDKFRKERISNIILKQCKDYRIFSDNVRNKRIDNEIEKAVSDNNKSVFEEVKQKPIGEYSGEIVAAVEKHNKELLSDEDRLIRSLPVAPTDDIRNDIASKKIINDIECSADQKQSYHNLCRQRLNSLENIIINCKQAESSKEVLKLMYLYRKYSLLIGRSANETLNNMISINNSLKNKIPLDELINSTNAAEVNTWNDNIQIKSSRGFIKSLNISDADLEKYSPALKNEKEINADNRSSSIDKSQDQQPQQDNSEMMALAGFGSRLFRDMTNMLDNNQSPQSPSKALDKLRGKKDREAELNRGS